MEIKLFPQELLELQKELLHPDHTEFNRELSQHPRPFDEVLSDLCTKLNLLVEGMYGPDDQLALASRCTDLLVKRRRDMVKVIMATRN